MRILAVIHAFPPEGVGGTERYASTVLGELRRRGHEVHVFAGTMEWRPQVETSRAQFEGIPVERIHRSDLYFDHWDKLFNPHVSRRYEELLTEVAPDVVHVHHWIRLSSDLVRRAVRRKIPVVVHLHDLYTTCPRVFRIHKEQHSCHERMGPQACVPCVQRWGFQGDAEIRSSLEFYSAETRAEIEAASLRIAPSSSHARNLERHLDLPPGSIEVLPHPRIAQAWPRAVPARSPRGSLKLLFFAQLHPIKGLHRVLEALHLLASPQSVELDVYGGFATPEYEQRVRGLAEGLVVRLHGAYENGQPAQCSSDAVVIPSLAQESYSFWLDEAHDLGLPILSSRCGALSERASARGILFDVEDPQDLASRIRELRDDPELRETLSCAAAPGVIDVGTHVDALLNSYARAIQRGTVPLRRAPLDVDDVSFEWDRRERAFQELLRSEGWEQVLAQLQQELDQARGRRST